MFFCAVLLQIKAKCLNCYNTCSTVSLTFIDTNGQYIKHVFSYYKHAYVRFVLCRCALWKTHFLGSVSHKFASHYWTRHINPENALIRLLATRLIRLVLLTNPPYIIWTDLSFVDNSYTYSCSFPNVWHQLFSRMYGTSYAVSGWNSVQVKFIMFMRHKQSSRNRDYCSILLNFYQNIW